MEFGDALKALKLGAHIARSGWNGKGMWLALLHGHDWFAAVADHVDLLGLEKLPFIVMKTADNKVVPWLASQTDILADDWVVL